MHIPKYFTIKECFPPYLPFHKSWKLFDERILISADQLRERFGPLIVNINGYTQCGFRTNGSLTSQHRFGKALDLHSKHHSYYNMRKYILEHKIEFPFITFLEIDINWLHIDCRNCTPIKLWSPKRGWQTEKDYLSP
jgi:hypothetical protein